MPVANKDLRRKYMWIIIIGILVVVIALVLIFIFTAYNGLVSTRQKVKNSWGHVEVQLQRRFDLLPNLVETVKGYMKHEEKTLTEIARLRTSWASAGTMAEKAGLSNQLESTLKSIMALSESYPELKANTGFFQLQQELGNTENKIAFSRQFYNDTVTIYNTKIEVFPSNLVAGMFGFKDEELFTVEDNTARMNPGITF